jgi:hypothetical protein
MLNNKNTFAITIRRIVREDIVMMIDAENEEEAKQQAMSQAPNEQGWDCYDCEYFID